MDNNVTRDNSMNVQDFMNQRNAQLEQNNNPDYGHGDYVPGENGEAGGILIDGHEEMRKQTESPQINDIKKYIDNQQNMIDRLRSGESPASVMRGEITRTDKEISDSSRGMDKVEIDKVRRVFEGYEMSANGLAPAGSKEAQQFKQKMDALERGEVNLEDYRDVKPQPHQSNVTTNMATVEAEPNIDNTDPSIVQFNVPSDKVNTFISTLNKDERSRIQRTSTVVVNEIKTLNIPTNTRVITNIKEYKRIAPRSIFSDTVDCVLPNSGYVATVKGCGALSMAVLVPELQGNPDMSKRYTFCYENLVTTSIGKLSYQEFVAHTSMYDINILLFNILRVSESDEQTITLNCGASTCGKDYDIKYKVSELIDTDKIDEKLATQIDEIVKARDVVENAKAKHESSPVMVAKYIQIVSDTKKIIVELKSPDGTIAVERLAALTDIVKQSSSFIAGLLMYIPRIYIEFTMDGESNPATYEIVDPNVIAEEIGDMNDSSIQAMTNIIGDMTGYDAMTYSFKGEYKCPHCGRIETRVPCEVERLIFFRVQRAMQ